MSEMNKKIFELADEFRRNDEIFDANKIIQVAIERGINVDYSTIRSLRHAQGVNELVYLPESISTFIVSVLKDFHPKNVIDPEAFGSLLSLIVEQTKPEKAWGISRLVSEIETYKLIEKNKNLSWIAGETFQTLKEIKDEFDLIVCSPPIGLRAHEALYNEEPDLFGDYGLLLLVKVCRQLSNQGMGIFIVPGGFFEETINHHQNNIRNVLSKYGLYVDSAFLLSQGLIQSTKSTDAYLVVIKRGKPSMLFVGQIFDNKQQNTVVIQNYHERKEAKVPQQGALVDANRFKGLHVLLAKHSVDKIVIRSGLNSYLLGDITTSINMPKLIPESEFEEAANVIYLSSDRMASVVTSVEEITDNPGIYVQIVLNDEKAYAPFVAKLLNSRFGLLIRDIWFSNIQKLAKTTPSFFESLTIYLPDIRQQQEIIRINSVITNLSAELTSLQNELWDFASEPARIDGKLRRFSQEKGWEIWLEELPFPLASIIWAYLATTNPKDKLEHISHFFEASIQFLGMICLSALAQNKEYYRINQKTWNTENPKYKGWYKNASFGNWLSLHSSLAKFIRDLLSREETKNKCLSLFGNANEQFIQAIVSKKLLGIFQDANTYRNLWIGHRGRLSDEEARKRVAVFEDLLSKMRDVIGDNFAQILFLSPQSSEYIDGIFEYKVKAIKGTRTEFKEQTIQSIIPLDKNKLYMLPELQLTPVEVLPFGKLMASPSTTQNAFYFYSRFDKEGVRWVSYHFEKEAEVIRPDNEMVDLMKELFDGEIQ